MSRIVKSKYYGIKDIPTDLSSDALQVYLLLSRCFQVANNIREAPLHDVLWGLSKGGYPPGMLMNGMRGLQESNYIVLTDGACNVLDLSTVGDVKNVWYMITDRWIDTLAGPGEIGKYPDVMFDTVKI